MNLQGYYKTVADCSEKTQDSGKVMDQVNCREQESLAVADKVSENFIVKHSTI